MVKDDEAGSDNEGDKKDGGKNYFFSPQEGGVVLLEIVRLEGFYAGFVEYLGI